MKLPSYTLAFKSTLDNVHSKDDFCKIDIDKNDKLFLLYNSEENILKIRSVEDGKFSIDIYIHQIQWGDIVNVCGFVYSNNEFGSYLMYRLTFHFTE